MHSASSAITVSAGVSRWPALAALILGLFVVYGTGFASPSAIHSAVHDTRHAFGLPCH